MAGLDPRKGLRPKSQVCEEMNAFMSTEGRLPLSRTVMVGVILGEVHPFVSGNTSGVLRPVSS